MNTTPSDPNAERREVTVDKVIADLADKVDRARRDFSYWEERAARGLLRTHEQTGYDTSKANLDAALDVLRTAEADYDGWSRFFLVTNKGGHIHRSLICSTCRPTTRFGWLPELSGLSEADAVDEYGSILCSVCFPDAPVDWTNGVNKKDAEARAFNDALAAIARTPEGKKVNTKRDLVTNKQYRVSRLEAEVRRRDDELARNPNSDNWCIARGNDAEAELPKVRKQLVRAETQLAEAEAILAEGLAIER